MPGLKFPTWDDVQAARTSQNSDSPESYKDRVYGPPGAEFKISEFYLPYFDGRGVVSGRIEALGPWWGRRFKHAEDSLLMDFGWCELKRPGRFAIAHLRNQPAIQAELDLGRRRKWASVSGLQVNLGKIYGADMESLKRWRHFNRLVQQTHTLTHLIGNLDLSMGVLSRAGCDVSCGVELWKKLVRKSYAVQDELRPHMLPGDFDAHGAAHKLWFKWSEYDLEWLFKPSDDRE